MSGPSTFCRWDGPREEAADEPCNATISTGRSGYCHCRRHRHVARFDCGHPPLRCDQACAVLEDAPTVRALAYTALMAFDDRAAALSLAFGGGRRRRDASQRPPARPSSRSDAAGGAGRIPVTLYQTIDKLDRPGIGLRWEESEPLGLRRVLHDDVLGQQYLNASWGPRFARAYGQISLGPIRGLANESVIDGFHASMKLGQISLGPIRGDFLRLAYIAEHGGFYADADVCPVHNSTLSRLAASGAPLVIVASMFSAARKGKGDALGAVPRHPDLQPLVWAALYHVEAAVRGYDRLGATAVAGLRLVESARTDFRLAVDSQLVALLGPQLMGSLLGAQPKVVLLENTTGTAHLPGEPTLALGPCDGLVKDWAAWAGRGGWHREAPVRFGYAHQPVVETKWEERRRRRRS
ncbi:hypothetical protein EMIHUDRAFT_455291 [Emiliania huxleyi CCMP1516]|uniref:Uncharacterized protein n=2 Tax=Emiliania huxleyi TaxID=2903 RepID=A0A0D3KJ65_EMIH1|nr:hypothetical protein EMIHUDRAFT_455291 [Emiliania huxleyi CCMP1516]EOD35800.1 hypothetical protein EMIHUDRAFT_455291 [Emiliania huxleyi CCMP1516]|eukprot:XP_005788229.1 hypothetical protein EMIHUDRAFT_455291 [Emiliania huxleyi CCMP1516]